MTELHVFRGTTGHAEMVTDDKSGKKLPRHSFGEWVFSRTINVAGETRLIGDVNCTQVLANVAKDGFHHWPELKSDFQSRREPPVRPPTLPPDFPDIPQNPSSELQPPPDPSAAADKVAGATPELPQPETPEAIIRGEMRRKNARLRGKINSVLEQHPELRDATDELALKQGTQVQVGVPFLERIQRIREDARRIGPATAALCEQILESRPHPEQGYRACLGIVRLAGSFGAARLETAAERAIEIGARTYGSVKSILDNKLDRSPAPRRPADTAPILHPNIRGPRYYH